MAAYHLGKPEEDEAYREERIESGAPIWAEDGKAVLVQPTHLRLWVLRSGTDRVTVREMGLRLRAAGGKPAIIRFGEHTKRYWRLEIAAV